MLLPSSSIPHILQQVGMLQPEADSVVLLLFSEQDVPDIPELIAALNTRNIPFLGGVFPGLLYGNQRVMEGCILKNFKTLLPPFCVTGIASSQLDGLPPFGSVDLEHKGTALVLFDGLSPNLYCFLEELNDLLGKQCDFIGGGAGSISLRQQACVFNNEGFFEDAALVCVIDNQVSIGVRHGWEHLAGPLVATHTEGNTILQLNWQKAIEVYSDLVEQDCGLRLTQDNFAGIAQGYPFGILREKADDIVRDPLAMLDNGAIVCIGEVPPNTVLHILKGCKTTLLEAAKKAVLDCSANLDPKVPTKGTFVVDCITRTLFLDQEFSQEIALIHQGVRIEHDEQEPFGILSLGELASYGAGLLELFNKTIVIGRFY